MTLKRFAAFAAVVLVSSVSACGSSDSPEKTGADSISTDSKFPKIAYLAVGSNNSYLQANLDEAKKTADELGVDLDIFDPAFDLVDNYHPEND